MSATAVQEKKFVQIAGGFYNGQEFGGVYQYLNQRNCPTNGKQVQVVYNGIPTWINLNEGRAQFVAQDAPITIESAIKDMPPVTIQPSTAMVRQKLTEAEVEAIIERRFRVMDTLVRSLEATRIRSVIVTGAAGIGKTYGVEKYLTEAELTKGQHWESIGGKCSPIGLYEALWSCRNEGSVLVLDDVEVWEDQDSLNILKKALDTNERRIIDWKTAGKHLDEKGIPDSFEMKGKVVFLTNVDAYREISRGSKKAPHLNALISRSVFLDLGIHDTRTIMLHVRNVTRKANMLVERGLTEEQQEDVLAWLQQNVTQLQTLSLRTPLMIGEYILVDPENWRDLAIETMLKVQPLYW